MTVFSLRGSKILTDQDGQITAIQNTTLDAVTRIGTNTLDVAYLGDPQDPFAVSLSDYNLLFDRVHINDADLPSRVEFFDLMASDGYGPRVLSFVFETEMGMEERMFSMGQTPLPDFRSASDASLFFAQHEPLKITAQDNLTIHFDQLRHVETSGVFASFDSVNAEITYGNDGFDFGDLDTGTDIDVWDIEFANAARLPDAISDALHPTRHEIEEVELVDSLSDSQNDAPIPNDFNDG